MEHPTQTRTQRLLTSLRESIVDKPPYISGTLKIPDPFFSLFYKLTKDGLAARYINLANATPDELGQLTQACEPASFGVNQENVLDEAYRKAGKMDSDCFASMLDPSCTDLIKIIRGYLLEGTQSSKGIKAELYKLNVYGEGSFFKPHVDTPRGNNMFGSLVIVFPTPHEGGALLLRHRGHEWTFNSGQALAAEDQPSIGYVAFFSDIEHEVAPVISGHRITLTYNLYFDDDSDGPVSSADDLISELTKLNKSGLLEAVNTLLENPESLTDPDSIASVLRQARRQVDPKDAEHLIPPQSPNEGPFREAFLALLEEPEFLADGGTLAFGLRHVYPIKTYLKHVYSILKGSDAVVYQVFRALGYEPVLYVYYEWKDDPPQGVLIDRVIQFENICLQSQDDDVVDLLLPQGGIVVGQGGVTRSDPRFGKPEQLEWVTPMTNFNEKEGAYPRYGNEPTVSWVYGYVCLVVRIGKAGDRSAYPTVAELNKGKRRAV